MMFSSKLQPGVATEGEEASMSRPLFQNWGEKPQNSQSSGVRRHWVKPSSPDAYVIISKAAQLSPAHLPWPSMVLALNGFLCF